jgi:histidine triad (HIT) family protein
MAAESSDCIFCQIIAGAIPAPRLREDEDTLIFPDVAPQAPTHVLVVPKRHLRDIGELGGDPTAAAAVLTAIRGFTAENALTDYRVVFNTGAGAGQSVFHVHAHLLSGRSFGWPPG